ncbi:hypothetical protein DP49_4952 [Burkholderia pseudomallei]|nr:hypothetical protein DP49_4952 [Burkholderia pseudomallei]RIV41127.1 hypothetical protein D2W70_33495 [Burkholderia pseudomallei]
MAGAREAALTRGAGATFAAGLPWLAAPGGAVHPALADAEPAERFDPVLGGTGFAPPFDSARGMAAEGCHPLGAAAGIRPFDSAGPGSITIRPVRGSVAARTSPDSAADSAPEAAPARPLHAAAACAAAGACHPPGLAVRSAPPGPAAPAPFAPRALAAFAFASAVWADSPRPGITIIPPSPACCASAAPIQPASASATAKRVRVARPASVVIAPSSKPGWKPSWKPSGTGLHSRDGRWPANRE